MTPRFGATARVVTASIALVVATTAYIFDIYLPAFNTEKTAITGVEHAPSSLAPTPGLAREIVFVVIDGLRYDVARSLPELAALRRDGVFRPLDASPPTFTGPSITAMVTGLGPRDSGVRLNGIESGAPGIDSVTEELGAAGVPIEVDAEGFEPFTKLVRAPKTATVVEGRVEFIAELAERDLGLGPHFEMPTAPAPARKVTFVHIEDVDDAGHRHGASSDEYIAAAHHAAHLLERIAAPLDLNQDVIIALSDHGHRDIGGHGGIEPEVRQAFLLAAGGLFRRGVQLGSRPMRDVAPTLAITAGVRAPTSSLGRPMLDLFSAEEPVLAALFAVPFDQTGHLVCRLSDSPRCREVDPMLLRLAAHDVGAVDQAEGLLDDLDAARERRIESESLGAARLRVGLAALLVVIATSLLVRAVRRAGRGSLRPVAGLAPILHVSGYVAYLASMGARATFSGMSGGSSFTRQVAPAALFSGLAALAITAVARPGRLAPWLYLLAVAAPYVLLVAWVGWNTELVVPPTSGVLVFQLAPVVLAAACGASALAWVVARQSDQGLSTSNENR